MIYKNIIVLVDIQDVIYQFDLTNSYINKITALLNKYGKQKYRNTDTGTPNTRIRNNKFFKSKYNNIPNK